MFDHGALRTTSAASVFWLRRLATFGDEKTTIEYWQVKRGGACRGIVEIIPEVPAVANDEELNATHLDRVRHFQSQLAHLRKVETNPVNYHLSASGFLAEIDRMQLEVREYLSAHPSELVAIA